MSAPLAVRPLFCEVGDCGRPTYRGALCSAHYQRKVRGQPLDAPLRHRSEDGWAGLVEASIGLADCCSERDSSYAVACARLRLAAYRFVNGEQHQEDAE